MICRCVFVLQAIKKSASILSQSALIRDSMYLHVFKRGTSGGIFLSFSKML